MTIAQSRVMAVVLLLLVVGILLLTIIRPLGQQYLERQEQIIQIQDHALRYQQLSAAARNNEQQLKLWQRNGGIGRYLFANESPGVAAARLQERIKAIIVNEGGQLLSTQNLPSIREAELERIGVGIKIRSSIEVIKAVLVALEGSKPLLFIEDVSVTRRDNRRTRRARSSVTPVRHEIDFQMNVSGYMSTESETR